MAKLMKKDLKAAKGGKMTPKKKSDMKQVQKVMKPMMKGK